MTGLARALACVGLVATALAATAIQPARTEDSAASYPSKPVRILVGFPPGVAPDITGRLIADKLTEVWGRPVLVENVSGAGGNIAADRAAKAAPDGYTLFLGSSSALVINPSLYDKLPYDPIKDFEPITQVFVNTNILVLPTDVPARSVPELVALARAQPGKLTYGHSGAGTTIHLSGELFKSMARLDIQPVAYRGSTAILPDLLAGRLTLCFCNITTTLASAREGRLRPLAVTALKRSSAAPSLPTMIELGYPGFEASPWFGLMAPAGTSPAIIDKVHRETVRILALPEVRRKLEELGIDPIGGSPAELAAVIKSEIPQWAKVIRDAGIKLSE